VQEEEVMLKTTLVVTAGILIGAGSAQMLHAQMKPPAYQIAIIDVKDDAGYKQAVADVRKRISDMGGKFIVTAGAGGGTGQLTSPTGDKANRVVVTEWSNMDAANKWWAEAGEKDIKALGQHATLHLYTAEGLSK
jgi:uncharacterized protein (DUF1330 family)